MILILIPSLDGLFSYIGFFGLDSQLFLVAG